MYRSKRPCGMVRLRGIPGMVAARRRHVPRRSIIRQSFTRITSARMVAIRAISGVAVFMPIGVIARSGMAIRALPKPNTARTSVETRMMRRTATVTPSKAMIFSRNEIF
jgi:hypothetical protein